MVDKPTSTGDLLAQNTDALRRRQAPHIGGAYGRSHFLPGFAPPDDLVLFTDGTWLDSDNRDTVNYPATWPVVLSEELDIDAGDDFSIEIILRSNRPFNNIHAISIPGFGELNGKVDKPQFAAARLDQNFIVGFRLLKVDLTPGATFGLDKLTYNNAAASNFSRFPGAGAGVGELHESGVGNFEPDNPASRLNLYRSVRTDTSSATVRTAGTSMSAGQTYDLSPCTRYFRGAGMSDGLLDLRTVGDSGPFTGIHLFFDNQIKYGIGVVSAAGNNARTRLTIPDPTDDEFETRGFVLTDVFNVTDGA